MHTSAWGRLLPTLPRPVVVYEVGCWMGRTTRWLLEHGNVSRVVAIDQWAARGYWLRRLEQAHEAGDIEPGCGLLDQYVSNLWDLRRQVEIIQGDSVTGMHLAAESPDIPAPSVVYIDADHCYHSVINDVRTALDLWPHAVICGDDYEDRPPPCTGVRRAVHELAAGRRVTTIGRWWRYE